MKPTPWREMLLPLFLVAVVVALPAVSIQGAAWSDRLEPVSFVAIAAVLFGASLAARVRHALVGHLIGVLGSLSAISIVYALYLPQEAIPDRLGVFLRRLADWLAAAYSGAAGTDNLLFAYTMALVAALIGYVGGWASFRNLNPWWAIIASGSALLLNLSYAPPDLLPLLFLHLTASFMLLVALNAVRRVARWRTESVEYGIHQGAGFAITSVAVATVILIGAWRMPAGQVNRGVASAWENVAGPWQAMQSNFDRMFASLNPSPLSGRGLTVAQTMAPRGSFELGTEPVMRVAGREPAYWRAATYDRYTGRVMAISPATSTRIERNQIIEGGNEPDSGRRYTAYTMTVLAPSTSVVYAPDTPIQISVPSVYDYRADTRDFGLLRPIAPIREQQRYNVFASVSAASVAELRTAGTIYPGWTRTYLQLPPSLPDRVRQEAWRVVGEANNAYDAASRVEQYLRDFRYSTHVPVPPADRDWVSFLLFDSREGYCDYFATAMTVLLRAVGIPARVASGYVTGEWESANQSYLVSENHAHTWTEVYFPEYGWITFEPSANRQAPARLSQPLTPRVDEFGEPLGGEFDDENFFEDEEEFPNNGTFVPLSSTTANTGPGPLAIVILVLLGLLLMAGGGGVILWFWGIGRLPAFAQPYAQVTRLATWAGAGPRPGQTPYEYTGVLARLVPEVTHPLREITEAYIAGTYGGRQFDGERTLQLRRDGAAVLKMLFRSLALAHWQARATERMRAVAGADRRR